MRLEHPAKHIEGMEHHKLKDIAAEWKIGYNTALRWFRDEPGVLALGTRSRTRRTRVELRVPEEIKQKVYADRLQA